MKGMIYKDLLNIKTQIIYYSAAIAAITIVSLFQNNIYFFCGFICFTRFADVGNDIRSTGRLEQICHCVGCSEIEVGF